MNLKQIPNIPLDEYINLSFMIKFGYYIKKPFGKKVISLLTKYFKAIFRNDCNLILSFWQNLGSPKNLNLLNLELVMVR